MIPTAVLSSDVLVDSQCVICGSVLRTANSRKPRRLYCQECRLLAKSVLTGRRCLQNYRKTGVFISDEDRWRAELLLSHKSGVSYGYLQHWKQHHILEYRKWLRNLELHYSKGKPTEIVFDEFPEGFPKVSRVPLKNLWGTKKVMIHGE